MSHLRDCVGEGCGRKEAYWSKSVPAGMLKPDVPLCSHHEAATRVRPGRIHPGVGTGIIVMRWEEDPTTPRSLLMVHRKGKHGDGEWSVPGGWIEKWEDIWKSGEREVLEETGIACEVYDQGGWTDAQHTVDGIHAVTLWLWADHRGGILANTEPDKAYAVAWIPVDRVWDRPLFHPFKTWWNERAGTHRPVTS